MRTSRPVQGSTQLNPNSRRTLSQGDQPVASIGDLSDCAARHLDRYCGDPVYAWPAYDDDPIPTRLTAVDLLAPELLSAGITWREALAMANDRDNAYSKLWDAILAVVEDERAHTMVFEGIDSLEDDESWTKVGLAFEHCQHTRKIKTTTVSKILHRKLPALVPINDRLVRQFYAIRRGYTWSLWPRLHDDINAHRDLIDDLRDGRSTPGGREMTRLRCVDIAVWTHVRTGCPTDDA